MAGEGPSQTEVERAVELALQHDLKILERDGSVVHAPFTLHPTLFPRAVYDQAVRLQPMFNRLVHAIVRERAFLTTIVTRLAKHDDFMARLATIYLASASPRTFFSVSRSDYMLHNEHGAQTLLQIELNTISAGCIGLAAMACRIHTCMHPLTEPNPALTEIAQGMRLALQHYAPACRTMLMVVHAVEFNIYDQDLLVAELQRIGVATIKATLASVAAEAVVDAAGRLLLGGTEIGLVYFRTGYSPANYPTDAEWHGRAKIEASAALKCPDIGTHLAGIKKVQQVLAQPAVLERFLPAQDAAEVRATFAGLYALDEGEQCEAVIDDAIRHPAKYVLKPQREGGGNNFYGNDMATILSSASKLGDLAPYILMSVVCPAPHPNSLVRRGVAVPHETVSELGIFGCYLAVDGDVKANSAAGYLLRTKALGVLEGGVASGSAALDSLVLE